jgi:hypothetical protein
MLISENNMPETNYNEDLAEYNLYSYRNTISPGTKFEEQGQSPIENACSPNIRGYEQVMESYSRPLIYEERFKPNDGSYNLKRVGIQYLDEPITHYRNQSNELEFTLSKND